MHSKEFTADEFTPFVGILILVVMIVLVNYFRGYKEFWSPLTIIAMVYAYYCCLGPYEAVLTGDTFDRLQNMRKFYTSAFWGAFVSLISYLAGFVLHGRSQNLKQVPDFSGDVLFEYGRNVFLIGFILFTISTGGRVTSLINPLDAEYVPQSGGTFGNYFALALNFVIPGISLLFMYFLLSKKKIIWFIVPFLLAVGIFTTLGFRYRIVLLLCSLAIIYYMVKQKRPNLAVLALGLVGLIAVMGVINMTRRYGAGLNVKTLQTTTTENAYQSGLQEASIFQTSGAMIDYVPARHPYAEFQPIISTLLFPIPSRILPEKNSAQYLFEALDAIYGKTISKGAAVMAYGEYYLAFGWIGIVVGCAITGWYLRKLWNWFLANSNSPFAIVVYAVTISFLYMVLSRGYLPQVTMLFFFTVFPIYAALRMARNKYGRPSS